MDEKQEKKRRYNLRLEFIAHFNKWLDSEPPRWRFIRWRKWKNRRPVWEWISVDDRLPEENTTVIVATDNGIVFQCLYAYDGWNLWEGNEVNITHWQPMPQPPKGE